MSPFSVLFVGYSLEDAELNWCLEKNKALLGLDAGPHYALLPRSSDATPTDLELRSMELQGKGVRAIFYPAKNHNHAARRSAIEEVLGKLGIPPPKPRHELRFGWSERVTRSEMRRQLSRLKDEAQPESPLILRELSWDQNK